MPVDTYICPSCGSEVKVGAACPGCVPKRRKRRKKVRAAPKRKEWEQDSIYDGLDIPDDDFDYEDFVQREFGQKPHQKIGIKWYWWATALALLLGFALLVLSALW